MAEITAPGGSPNKRGGRRSKKMSTRVDLTPMVDLGFLLITFFILTTTWSKPHVTTLRMPAGGDSTQLGQNAALSLVPMADNRIFYYHGDLETALKEGSYGVTGYGISGGVGDIIRQKQTAMDRTYKGGRKEMMLLIKPAPDANYRNVVDLLDETLINQVGKYALVDLPAAEKNRISPKIP